MPVGVIDNLYLGNTPAVASVVTSPLVFAFADATYKCGGRFEAITINPITHVRLCVPSIAGTPPTYRVSLQALDANGMPTGTVLGGGSPASATFTPASVGVKEIALANAYTPTLSQQLAVVVDHSSGTVDFSNYAAILVGVTFGGVPRSNHVSLQYFGSGSFLTGNSMSSFVVRTASERYGGVLIIADDYDPGYFATTRSVSTSGQRVASKFTVPSNWSTLFASLAIRALQMNVFPTAGQSIKIGLWNAAGAAIATVDVDTDSGNANGIDLPVEFASAVNVAPGDVIYAGVESVSNSTAAIGVLDYATSADRDAARGLIHAGGTPTGIVSTWNGAAWSDSANDVAIVGFVLNSVTAAAGAAAGGGAGSRLGLCM